MIKERSKNCGNCKSFQIFNIDFEMPEDICGSCPKYKDELIYADDSPCKYFEFSDLIYEY